MLEFIGNVFLEFFFNFLLVKLGASIRYLFFLLIGKRKPFKTLLKGQSMTNGLLGLFIIIVVIALLIKIYR